MRLRPLGPGDDDAVRAIFRETLVLGRPAPIRIDGLAAYEHLCLGWFLGPERERAAVLAEDGVVLGYVLVAADARGAARWLRRESLRYARRIGTRFAARSPSGRFHRLRLVDSWTAWSGRRHLPVGVHAHMNALPAAPAVAAGLRFLEHVDAVCREVGEAGWYGEINARVGRRAGAIERYVGTVVHRTPNRTLSWLAGCDVHRLTVVRRLPDRPDVGAARPRDGRDDGERSGSETRRPRVSPDDRRRGGDRRHVGMNAG